MDSSFNVMLWMCACKGVCIYHTSQDKSGFIFFFQPALQLCCPPQQCPLQNFQCRPQPLSSHACLQVPCSPSCGSTSLQMFQFLKTHGRQRNKKGVIHFHSTEMSKRLNKCFCYIGRRWVTWEFLERQVGIGVVAGTADDRIKYMSFLLSILVLGQDLPLPTTGVVWSLFDTLY